jgi:C-terminal processing protease CtpA/Prc
MERVIRSRRRRGHYAGLTTARALADSLTAHLQAVSRDRHLQVRYSHDPLPPFPWRRGSDTDPADSARAHGRRVRFGVGRPERLAGNVGYLEIRSFAFEPEWAEETVAQAMSDLDETDALIIDLRRNGGGSPRLAAFVASYFMGPDSVHLATLYWRGPRTERVYTRSEVPGRRYGATRPLFVLTGRGTFSAAEGFAYNLQALGRAVIVGDTTGGGAHAGGLHRVTDHFGVWVPAARPVNPITGTNWERTGVRPDLVVPADSARHHAHRAALAQLRERATDAHEQQRLDDALARLDDVSPR